MSCISPVLEIPGDMTFEATAVLTPLSLDQLGMVSVMDNRDDGLIVTHDAPDSFPLGLTMIVYTATDESGNSVYATQLITIQDTTAPVITPISDFTQIDNYEVEFDVEVTEIFPTGVRYNYYPDDYLYLGDTEIICYANDTSGNFDRISFTVTMENTEKVVSLTQIDTGNGFVPFVDGITVNSDTPRFRGTSTGYNHVFLNVQDAQGEYYQIGRGGGTHDNGDWQRGLTVLADGTYSVLVNHVYFGTIVINGGISPALLQTASITQVYDGNNWVTFQDGMTISDPSPKFRGISENIGDERLYVLWNGGGRGEVPDDDGSWDIDWIFRPLQDGRYTLELQTDSYEYLQEALINIDTNGDGNPTWYKP